MKGDCSENDLRIAVTGVGAVSPLGLDAETTWKNLLAGQTGIHPFVIASEAKQSHGFKNDGIASSHQSFGTSQHYGDNWNGTSLNNAPRNDRNVRLEARVIGFSPNGARSRMGDFAVQAAAEALQNAGFNLDEVKGRPFGCAVSQSKPILTGDSGDLPIDPALILATFSGWSADAVVKRSLGLSGPSQNVVAACATGVASILLAMEWIREGKCDVVLAGAAESSFHPLYISGFDRMGALCRGKFPGDVRPFDLNRSGFAMGEGAAVLVLESEESLQKRKGRPLAFLKSVRMAHNAADPIRFDEDGYHVGRLIKKTVTEFGTVDYINAHGTATKINDRQETRGLKRAFGKLAHRIPISSTKAATGHLLGAAGAMEAAFCVLALRDQIVPPTLNLSTPDPDCDLDYVPNFSRKIPVRAAMSLSYGFGGQMGAVLFARGE